MRIINVLLQILWKFAKTTFVVVGVFMEYISKEMGRSFKESAKLSSSPRIWWW